MAKKGNENTHVLAVKNYEDLMKEVEESLDCLPGKDKDKETIKKLLSSPEFMVNQLKGLKKFIKKVKASKKDVIHYWEGLIVDGYTLISVEYENDTELRLMCDGEKIKYIE